MAYTRAFSVTSPAGTQLAKNIDNEIRDLRTDTKERIVSLLKSGTDIDADPLVLREEYSGLKPGKKLLLSFAAFNSDTSGKETYYDADKLIAFTDTGALVATISLAPGVVLQSVELLLDKQAAGSITWKVKSRPFGAGSTTTIETRTTSTVGLHVHASSTAPLATIANDTIYWIEIEGGGTAGNAFWVYGARLTYDAPADTRVTI